MPKWTDVKLSKPHRRKKNKVKGYTRKRTKNAHRNKAHKRKPRRTDAQISAAKAAKKRRKKKPQTRKPIKKVNKIKRTPKIKQPTRNKFAFPKHLFKS